MIKMNTSAIYKEITEKIIANLNSAGSWKKMWEMPSCASLSGHVYHGINKLILSTDKYNTPIYGTFEQIRSNGGVVRKGERATLIVFWKKSNVIDKETQEEKTLFLLRHYYVFNVEQADFDDIGKEHIASLVDCHKIKPFIESAQNVIERMMDKPMIVNSSKDDRAYYSPSLDKISVPDIRFFENSESYYHTLFHELIHSTGHPSRLDRFDTGSGVFASESYSKEELVAELGASYLCAKCNINDDIRNSAAYIAGWSKSLRDNPNWLITASSKAEQAADFVLHKEKQTVAA